MNPAKRTTRPTRLRRRGSTYLVVLSVALISAIIAAGALAISQAHRRMADLERNYDSSGLLAASAIDQALAEMAAEPDWRTVYASHQNGNYSPAKPLGDGTISWKLEDPVDNDITDSNSQPVRIYGRGQVGPSARAFSVMAFQHGDALDVLRTTIHAGGGLTVLEGLVAGNGPVSSNAQVKVTGAQLFGNVEAVSVDDASRVNGVITSSSAKTRPSRSIYSAYKTFASEIDFNLLAESEKLRKVLLSPASNPTLPGEKNVGGVYWIQVPAGKKLAIENCRIEGTLLIELLGAGAKLDVKSGVVWKPFVPHYPALIVYTANDSSTDVDLNCQGQLNESNLGINFNPSHTPYFNDSDNSADDIYAASLRGLFHVIRDVDSPSTKTKVRASNHIVGCVVADGPVEIEGTSLLSADTQLLAHPPLGYTTSADPNNVLVNGSMENGLAGWLATGTTFGGAGTKLNWSVLPDATHCIETSQRSSAASGIAQDVTTRMISGATFDGSVWLKMNDSVENAKVSLEINSTGSGTQIYAYQASVTTGWTQLQFQFMPTWTGELKYARFIVRTATTPQTFLMDNASITDPRTEIPCNLIPVPSSWRVETLP